MGNSETATDSVTSEDFAIQIRNLSKFFKTPLLRRVIPAVRGLTLNVHRGEVFGFLGPNGAGKTTTIRVLMGLIKASEGSAVIFGEPVPSQAACRKVGFLPEAPYFYDYLSVTEMLDLTGRLFGLGAGERRKRVAELVERVGLHHAAKTPLKKYSKGMMQRAGIAQALINDPELIVCDEPMSGLDPMGRRLVREILLEQRDRGKTVFFSSHILADVEAISDRVAIMAQGQMHDLGTVEELVSDTFSGYDVTLLCPSADWAETLAGVSLTDSHGQYKSFRLSKDSDLEEFLQLSRTNNAKVHSVTPRQGTIEDLFVALAEEHHTIHAEMQKHAR